jgi:hypothetical protein
MQASRISIGTFHNFEHQLSNEKHAISPEEDQAKDKFEECTEFVKYNQLIVQDGSVLAKGTKVPEGCRKLRLIPNHDV